MRSVSFILAVTLTCVNASADLASQIQPLINQHEGDVSVLIRNLETGEQFAWRERVVVPTASLIKLPVMVTAYRRAESGLLDLSRQIELKDEDKVPGSGILSNHFSAGTKISIRDAIRLMMRYSDNTATNLVIDQMGLPATSTQMEALGYPETRLHAKVYRSGTSISPARSQKYGLGSTTATFFRGERAVQMLCKCQRGDTTGLALTWRSSGGRSPSMLTASSRLAPSRRRATLRESSAMWML